MKNQLIITLLLTTIGMSLQGVAMQLPPADSDIRENSWNPRLGDWASSYASDTLNGILDKYQRAKSYVGTRFPQTSSQLSSLASETDNLAATLAQKLHVPKSAVITGALLATAPVTTLSMPLIAAVPAVLVAHEFLSGLRDKWRGLNPAQKQAALAEAENLLDKAKDAASSNAEGEEQENTNEANEETERA